MITNKRTPCIYGGFCTQDKNCATFLCERCNKYTLRIRDKNLFRKRREVSRKRQNKKR